MLAAIAIYIGLFVASKVIIGTWLFFSDLTEDRRVAGFVGIAFLLVGFIIGAWWLNWELGYHMSTESVQIWRFRGMVTLLLFAIPSAGRFLTEWSSGVRQNETKAYLTLAAMGLCGIAFLWLLVNYIVNFK